MTNRYKRITLFTSALLTLILPSAYSQSVPAISATVTTTQNQFCSSNSAWGLSIGYTGNYSATCYYASCPNDTWAATPGTLSQPSTGACNFVPAALIAAVANQSFTSMAAVAQYMGWPNYGPPSFSVQYGLNGSSSWARAVDQTFVANNSISVGVTIYIASVSFVIPIGQAGVTTYDSYMSCTGD